MAATMLSELNQLRPERQVQNEIARVQADGLVRDDLSARQLTLACSIC